MATCPTGHESADDDFCDVCGFAIGPAAVPATIAATVPAPCPNCGIPRAGQFCEACGYDFTASATSGGDPGRPRDRPAGGRAARSVHPARSVPPGPARSVPPGPARSVPPGPVCLDPARPGDGAPGVGVGVGGL